MILAYIIRHGQSVWNAERRWACQADIELSPKGEQEALDACESIKPLGIKCATSSTLKRARRTAEIISQVLDIPLKEPVNELSEINLGIISGLTSLEIEECFPGKLDRWRADKSVVFPGGEAWQQFVQRIEQGLLKLAQIEESPVLVVAHQTVLQAISYLLNEPQPLHRNCEGRWITVDDKGISASVEALISE